MPAVAGPAMLQHGPCMVGLALDLQHVQCQRRQLQRNMAVGTPPPLLPMAMPLPPLPPLLLPPLLLPPLLLPPLLLPRAAAAATAAAATCS